MTDSVQMHIAYAKRIGTLVTVNLGIWCRSLAHTICNWNVLFLTFDLRNVSSKTVGCTSIIGFRLVLVPSSPLVPTCSLTPQQTAHSYGWLKTPQFHDNLIFYSFTSCAHPQLGAMTNCSVLALSRGMLTLITTSPCVPTYRMAPWHTAHSTGIGDGRLAQTSLVHGQIPPPRVLTYSSAPWQATHSPGTEEGRAEANLSAASRDPGGCCA
eukprot:690860-Pelagomonas_calceolata.AAC.2